VVGGVVGGMAAESLEKLARLDRLDSTSRDWSRDLRELVCSDHPFTTPKEDYIGIHKVTHIF
jgi:hypothetical protein